MKISKQRLKEIIREELEYTPDIDQYPEPEEDEDPMANRLGTPEEQLLSRILARAVVDKYDSLGALAADLGVEMTDEMARYIGSLKANPMYGSSLEEGWGQGDRAYQQATQLLGQFAQLHGLRNKVTDALRAGKVTPQQVQQAVRGASSSYHVAQQLGLGE
tara:strand:+ start:3677 stop:4159 length:483 start_codon:yes stop_codon:yes gene_type:complete